MKQQAEQVQYTIRGVPREIDRLLRRRASQQKKSLNQVVLEGLAQATVGDTKRADFSDLVGRWTADPEFDKVLASMRQVDREKWK